MKRLLLASLLLTTATVVRADLGDIPETREELIAQIVAGGQNEDDEERHAVEVVECVLTTYRWKKQKDGSWLLWTSFRLPFRGVDLSLHDSKTGKHYTVADLGAGRKLAGVTFKSEEGLKVSHEKPFVRSQPKGDFTLSDRGDGASFFKEWKSSGAILHEGPDVEEKAKLFTEGYIRYQRKFCTFVS